MAKGTVNKVTLLGNLGQDPEVRNTASGMAVANMSIATTDGRKDQNGTWQDHTEWHRVTVFGKLAEICQQYLRKGSKVYVEGKLSTRKYQDKQTGADRWSTDIIVNELEMLGGNPQQGQQGGYQQQPPQDAWGTPAPQAQQQQAAMQPPAQQAPQQQAPQQAPQAAPQAQPNAAAQQQAQWQQPAQAAPQAAPQQQAPQAAPQPAPANNFDDFDDDIPF